MIRNALLLVALTSAIAACNFGNNVTPTQTPYLFSALHITSESTTVGCSTHNTGISWSCDAESSNLVITVQYQSEPASYLAFPTTYPIGITESAEGPNCAPSPVNNYLCTFTLVAESAESGIVYIPFQGSLGERNFMSINYN